ncbi:hypothetical protein EXW94_10365 [Enterobacter sp. JMULE2]|uniref:hypothetical protein n=1 Tax=Enterobacter sp. JMULE2 TaxID=2518340 RepID=UPI001576B379|nr:hypothetical protein [Enterobacter sp. JMULE2]NTZ38142.1 hypothetical protein [Enterobacter sp. JMULE2]
MREPISLDQAEHKATLAASLFEIILERANKECHPLLVDLISIACDFNNEIRFALIAETEKGALNG